MLLLVVAGFGVTVVVVVSVDTVRADEPELVPWVPSPGYVAVIVTDPIFNGVYDIIHWLMSGVAVASVHVELPKVPPAPLSPHDTVPVGAVFVPVFES